MAQKWKRNHPDSKFEKAVFRYATKAEIEKKILAVENMSQEMSNNYVENNSNIEIDIKALFKSKNETDSILFDKALDPNRVSSGTGSNSNSDDTLE